MLEFLGLVLIGGFAGYAAGHLMGDKGFGTTGNVFIGILGAVIGGFLLVLMGGLLVKLFAAFLGALVLFWIIGRFRPKKKEHLSAREKFLR